MCWRGRAVESDLVCANTSGSEVGVSPFSAAIGAPRLAVNIVISSIYTMLFTFHIKPR